MTDPSLSTHHRAARLPSPGRRRPTTRRRRAARPHRIGMTALAVGLVATLSLTSCRPSISWTLGRTHGVAIETGALRGNLNIYRSPRNALYEAYRIGGTNLVQDVLWHYGRPPRFSICVQGYCITDSLVASRIRNWIYEDDGDLRGALLAAQTNRDCLALTLISAGRFSKNWTHKRVGCYLGSLPVAGQGSAPADDGPLLPDGTTEPLDPDDVVPAGS